MRQLRLSLSMLALTASLAQANEADKTKPTQQSSPCQESKALPFAQETKPTPEPKAPAGKEQPKAPGGLAEVAAPAPGLSGFLAGEAAPDQEKKPKPSLAVPSALGSCR